MVDRLRVLVAEVAFIVRIKTVAAPPICGPVPLSDGKPTPKYSRSECIGGLGVKVGAALCKLSWRSMFPLGSISIPDGLRCCLGSQCNQPPEPHVFVCCLDKDAFGDLANPHASLQAICHSRLPNVPVAYEVQQTWCNVLDCLAMNSPSRPEDSGATVPNDCVCGRLEEALDITGAPIVAAESRRGFRWLAATISILSAERWRRGEGPGRLDPQVPSAGRRWAMRPCTSL